MKEVSVKDFQHYFQEQYYFQGVVSQRTYPEGDKVDF